jgi:hypothetical protein
LGRLAAWLLMTLLSTGSLAEVRIGGDAHAVSMPYTRWELRLPAPGWVAQLQRSRPDGLQHYYMFTHASGLNASFYLEPAFRRDSTAAYRAAFWENPGPAYGQVKDAQFFDANGFAVVAFTSVVGALTQRHWSAHMVRDGVWIDMHLSTTAVGADAAAMFDAYAGAVAIVAKEACPDCLNLPGLSRADSMILFARARMNDAEAWRRLRELAEHGDAEAQFMVARLYSWGAPLVDPDETQSVHWVRRAADQGHLEAMTNLGFFHDSGRGVARRDAEAARRLWTGAAEQGYAPAQYNLGNLFRNDPAMADPAKALAWIERAAKAGLAPAQTNLGYAHGRGVGVPRNFDTALFWYRRAAAQGSQQAMLNVAGLLGLDIGEPEAVREALQTLRNPLLRGDERAAGLKARICGSHPDACRE